MSLGNSPDHELDISSKAVMNYLLIHSARPPPYRRAPGLPARQLHLLPDADGPQPRALWGVRLRLITPARRLQLVAAAYQAWPLLRRSPLPKSSAACDLA